MESDGRLARFVLPHRNAHQRQNTARSTVALCGVHRKYETGDPSVWLSAARSMIALCFHQSNVKQADVAAILMFVHLQKRDLGDAEDAHNAVR